MNITSEKQLIEFIENIDDCKIASKRLHGISGHQSCDKYCDTFASDCSSDKIIALCSEYHKSVAHNSISNVKFENPKRFSSIILE